MTWDCVYGVCRAQNLCKAGCVGAELQKDGYAIERGEVKKQDSKALIHVRFQRPGFHCWGDAPAHRRYLRDRHRHLFKVEVTTTVTHDEREIEYHDLLEVASITFDRVLNFAGAGGWSCERMARSLAEQLKEGHKRDFTVSVWEDGECGSTVSTGA